MGIVRLGHGTNQQARQPDLEADSVGMYMSTLITCDFKWFAWGGDRLSQAMEPPDSQGYWGWVQARLLLGAASAGTKNMVQGRLGHNICCLYICGTEWLVYDRQGPSTHWNGQDQGLGVGLMGELGKFL